MFRRNLEFRVLFNMRRVQDISFFALIRVSRMFMFCLRVVFICGIVVYFMRFFWFKMEELLVIRVYVILMVIFYFVQKNCMGGIVILYIGVIFGQNISIRDILIDVEKFVFCIRRMLDRIRGFEFFLDVWFFVLIYQYYQVLFVGGGFFRWKGENFFFFYCYILY